MQKRLTKDIEVFLKKKKKIHNIHVNETKIYQKMKNKSWLSIEIYYKLRQKKCLIIVIKNYFHLKILVFLKFGLGEWAI